MKIRWNDENEEPTLEDKIQLGMLAMLYIIFFIVGLTKFL